MELRVVVGLDRCSSEPLGYMWSLTHYRVVRLSLFALAVH